MDQKKTGSEGLLAELIDGLTKKEAIAVREYLRTLTTKEGQLVLELYDALRTGRSRNEQGLLNRLASEELRKYLSYYKGRLREHVLDLLATKQRDEEMRCTERVTHELVKCWTLHGRGLKQEALQRLDALLAEPELAAYPHLRLLLLEGQHRILRAAGASGHAEELQQNHGRKAVLLVEIENREAYNLLEERVFRIYATYRQSNHSSVQQQLQELMGHELLQDEANALSFQARISFNTAHMLHSRVRGDRHSFVQYLERIVALWEQEPAHMARRPYVYQRALINLLNGYYASEQKERFEAVYAKAVNVKLKNKRDEAASIISLLSVRLGFLGNYGFEQEMAEMQGEVEEALAEYGPKANPSTVLNLRFNLGASYFALGQYKKAKRCFTELASDRNTIRKDLKGVSRVLLLLCEFDRENEDYVRSIQQQATRYYRNHQELSGLHHAVFGCINSILSQPKAQESALLREATERITAMDNEVGKVEVLQWMEKRLAALSARPAPTDR